MDMLEIMQTLNACHGPSGDEGEVAEAILDDLPAVPRACHGRC